jgi:hypothetical protein
MKKTARQDGIAVLGFLAIAALFMSCGGVIPTGESSDEPTATETATLQVKLGYLESLIQESLALTSSNLTVTLRNADMTGESVTQTVWEKPEELCLDAGASYFPPVIKYITLPGKGDNLEIELVFSGRCPYNDENGEVRGKYIVPITEIGPGINSNSTSDRASSSKIYFKGTTFPPQLPFPIVTHLPPHKLSILAPTDVLGICVEIDLLN